MRNKLRRPLAFLLSAVMIVTMSGTPVHAVSDRGQPETGLCEHHTAHTDDCGYTEETPGTPCGHEHTEDCYTEVTECVHEHDEGCYPQDSISDNEATPANAKEREPENCPHICDKESGCITEKLDCQHEHDSECGYTESTPGTPCTYVCEICNPEDSGEAGREPETGIIKQEQCSCLTLCTEGQINPDCPVCGAEDAGLSDCKGKAVEEDTKQPEDTGICKHHREHDDACGYQPASEDSEGSPCTYECRVCPVEELIAALPDDVTSDNADDVCGRLDEILALFSELTEDEQEQIDLSRCYALQGALAPANAPVAAGETHVATVTIGGVTTNYDTLQDAWTAAQASAPATVTLLQSVKLTAPLMVGSGQDITLNGADLETDVTASNAAVIQVNGGSFTLTSGTITASSTGSYGVLVASGTATISGGTITASGGYSYGVRVSGGTATISGGTITASGNYSYGVRVAFGTATISGGTITASGSYSCGVKVSSGTAMLTGGTIRSQGTAILTGIGTVRSLLGQSYAYYREDGSLVTDGLDGKELPSGTYTVAPCTHPDASITPNDDGTTHTIPACPVCGRTQTNAPHDWTPTNLTCTVCGAVAAAKIEKNNQITGYVDESGLDAAFAEDSGNSGATITLLADVTRTAMLDIRITCSLDLGGHTITCTGLAVNIWSNGNLTIQGTGEIISASNWALDVGGKVTLEGGTFTSKDPYSQGVYVNSSGASLSVTGKNVTIQNTGGGYGLAISNAQSVQLSGGKYSGTAGAIATFNSLTLGDLLAHSGDTRYAYFDESGTPPLTGVLSDQSLTGTVTVKKCEHDKSVCAYTPNEDADTHAMTCRACGLEGAVEDCQLTYTSNETQHTAACETCGRSRTEAHSYGSWEPQHNGTAVTIRRVCESCKYTKTDGTFTVPAPGQTMQYGTPITLTCSSTLPDATFRWILMDADIGADRTPVQESPGASFTPSETLAVGEYYWEAHVNWTGSDGETMPKSGYLSVLPAPLSNVNVTLSPASAVYNGTAQKPAVAIDGLTEGTDYTVAYTGDFTNAGTHTVTVTGKGNYEGTVTKTFIIEKAALTADGTGTASGTYGAKLSDLTVTDLTAKLGEAPVTGTWKLTGDAIPNAGNTETHEATFIPTGNGENYKPLTAQVTLNIAKATALPTKPGDLAVANKQEHTYTYGLGALRPDVQVGMSLGSTAVTYELGTVSLGGYYDSTKDGAKIEGQTLTLPIKAVDTEDVQEIGTVTVIIHTQNFEDMTATIKVRSTNKQSVDISGVTLTGRAYNGSPIEYQQTATASVDGKTVSVNGFVYTWDTPDHAAPVNAGNYTLTVSVDPKDQNYTGSTTIPVVIEQAEIRVTAPSKTIHVGETAPVFSAADCTITGLAQGENLKTPPTVAYAEAPDTSKTGSVTVTASGAKVPEGGNYKDRIVYENGTLTITSKPLPPAKYTVTVQAGTGGTASASPTSAEKGTKITLTATPDSGYHFKEWQVISGSVTISNNSFTMPATNVTVKAVFEKDSNPPQPTRYSVTVQAGTGGTASASPVSAEKGTKITLTATPDGGYHFKEWQVISGGVTISSNSFTMPDTNVTVKAVFVKNSNGSENSGGSGSGGGSSSGGGGSSSGDNGSSGGGSTIVARPDETKPEIPTTSQTKPATPDKDGNVAVDNGTVQSAINAAKNDAKNNSNTANGVAVVIPVTPKEGQNSFNVTINAQTLNTLVRENVKRLEINIEGVVVGGMDTKLLKWLDTVSANGDIILRVKQITQASLSKEAKAAIGTRPVYDLSLVYLSGGKETPITDFDGHTIAVRLPYAPAKEEQAGNLYAVYVDGRGKVEWLTKSSYDPDLGTVVFETGHFSIYGIGYKNPAPDFTDIKNHWAEDNIIFVASRGLLTGTGNNQFSPNMGMTRGMFVTALGRLAGIDPDSYKTGKFTDVKADAYYAPYVNWAAEKGIVNGTTSTTFSPDTNITREQMAVIMANYAKKLGYDLPVAHEAVTFADNAQISGWAAKEVKAMQQAGILAGKGGNRFDPKGTATRAEVATVLRRFVEIVIDPQTAQGWMQNHSGSWQYLKNGKPVTGWLYDDKKWYWLDSNGWMFAGGFKQIDGKWYYFYSDGSMSANTTIDGYTIGPDGVTK